MSAAIVIPYLAGAVALGAAFYVCFGKRILNVTIALFVLFCALSILFLSLGSEYLALISALVGILGSIIILSFSSVVVGVLRDPSLDAPETRQNLAARVAGFFLGLLVGGLFAAVFVTLPYSSSRQEHADAAAVTIGRTLLGEHTIVLELAGITSLAMIMAMGILLRSHRKESHDA